MDIVTQEQLDALSVRVAKLEQAMQPLSIIESCELHDARIDYSNDVTLQWGQIKHFMDMTAIDRPIIVNTRIMVENAMRLIYRGIRCEPVPFTHYTQLSFVGRLEMIAHLEMVD